MVLRPPQDVPPTRTWVEVVPDDDPIATLPDATRTARRNLHGLALVVGMSSGFIGIVLAAVHADLHPVIGTLLLIAMCIGPLLWTARRRLNARPATHSIFVRQDIQGRSTAWLPIARRATVSPFDPDTHGHLSAAHRLRRVRLRDGAVLERLFDGALLDRDGDTRGVLRINLDALSDRDTPITHRVEDWEATAAFLKDRVDPRAAWLAAIACTEDSRWSRALKALDHLKRTASGRPRRERMIDWLSAHGPRAARIAGALARGDVDWIDALLSDAEPDDPVDALVALMNARWREAPDLEALGRWRTRARLLPALARLPVEDASLDHWLALITDTPLDVALVAARTALHRRPPAPIAAARALLDRADLRARFAAQDTAEAESIRTADAALALLARSTHHEDVPRLGAWSRLPGPLQHQARSYAIQLRQLVGAPDTAGALTMADAEGAAGRLSAPEGAEP